MENLTPSMNPGIITLIAENEKKNSAKPETNLLNLR